MDGARDILSRTMWAEARGEGEKGIQAVACVILNRVNNPRWWGRDVVTVCLKPFQFSCYNVDDPNRAKLLAVTAEDPSFALALQIADKALAGLLPDITLGSDSYYAEGSPKPHWTWNLAPTIQIGKHLFYRTV